MNISINIDASRYLIGRLKEIHRSAFPVAIMQTLNSCAFDVKKSIATKHGFVKREPNFIRANSTVEKVSGGFSVPNMKASIGMTEKDLRGNNNFAVKELEQQEEGGTITNRTFVPMRTARIGMATNKNVSIENRLSNIPKNKRIDASAGKARTAKQRYIRAAFMAQKLNPGNAFVLGNVSTKNGKQTLSRIDALYSNAKNKQLKIDRTPLYSVKHGRSVSVESTGFMKRASFETGLKANKFFIEHAQKQLSKYMKK